MERKTGILMVILVLVPMLLAASWKTRIYKAYIGSDMHAWKTAMDEMESQKTSDNVYLAELINYQYGYIAYCLDIEDHATAEHYLVLAEKNLDKLKKQGFSLSITQTYQSAFYGYKIGLSPLKAPFIGPKSVKQALEAIKNDPLNPLGYIQYGNAQFYMPAVFGGSKTEAIKYFQKAEKQMEEEPDTWMNQNWNYLNLLALIGQSFEALKEYKQAQAYYKKALAEEPGFAWVKDELLPNLEKIIENE